MIDQDEMDAYEEWKASKLAGHVDISVAAWNREQEALALAWEDGARKAMAFVGANLADLRELLDQNPHRKPGMTGFRKPPVNLEGPHSRACGISKHDHGSECASDCPTCGGKR